MNNPFAKLRQSYQRSLMFCGITVVLIALQPLLWNQVQTQTERLNEKQSSGQQIAAVQQRIAEITADINAQTADVAEIETVAPPEADLTEIIDNLEQVADEQGVSIDITNINRPSTTAAAGNTTAATALSSTVVTLQAQGTVNDLLSYLEKVEYMPKLTLINRVAFLPVAVGQIPTPPTQGGQALYTMDLDVTFFLSNI